MSAAIDLTAYRPTDLPACLAAAGLLRVLAGRAGIPVRLSWAADHARLHLPDGVSPAQLAATLTALAVEQSDAPEWAVYDLCDDAKGWEAEARELVPRSDSRSRRLSDALAACGCYLAGEGGRSPLITTARNATPGRWARKAAAAAQDADWLAHFARWRSDQGSWQGWRRPDEPGADLAAVWLALEGLAYWACLPAHNAVAHPSDYRMTDGRRGVSVAGYVAGDASAGVPSLWRYPLPGEPVSADAIRTAIAHPRMHRHAAFNRAKYQQGGHWLTCFDSGAVAAAELPGEDEPA